MDILRRSVRRARNQPPPTLEDEPATAHSGDGSTRLEPVLDCAFATALGNRPDNQDRCAVSDRWIVLSDGAGGHAGGALAAQVAVDEVVSCLRSGRSSGAVQLEEAVSRANEAVRARRRENSAVAGMAATLTVAVASAVAGDIVEWLVTSVGDSPAYVVKHDGAEKVTEDDNVAGQLVRSGAITPAEALDHPGKHWITRAIGPEDRIAVHVTSLRLRGGEALLIASDGLDVLSPATIGEVTTAAATASEAAEQLVREALRSGSLDNVTVAVARHPPSSCHRWGDEPAA